MIKIGLTGGIGSGKTTVANCFKDKGVPVFIADTEAKKILEQPEVSQAIAHKFDIQLLDDGSINKKELASIVFKDKVKLEQLNSIIHPKVHDRFKEWVSQQNAAYIIYEAAIIFEQNRASDFDFTILVTAPKNIRIERIQKRDQVSSSEVKSRMDAQWPEDKKQKLADFIVENINIKETHQQVDRLHEKFLKLSDK